MRIRRIKSQHRRDFTAIYVCEHYYATQEGSGYDDANFHNNVIPAMECKSCRKKADAGDYRPLAPKYPQHQVV